jgi:2-C-methyl-D-erythritol 4-phosphate cytidylyltransferase
MQDITKDNSGKVFVIIPSAGAGRRLGGIKKNFLTLNDTPLLALTLRPFEDSPLVDSIVIAVAKEDIEFCKREVVEKHSFTKVIKIVAGGAERQESVRLAIESIKDECAESDIILVHDGARPLVTLSIITAVIEAAREYGASIAAVRPKDTIKSINGEFVEKTLTRNELLQVQTPQGFSAKVLRDAFKEAAASAFIGTDESSLVERLDYMRNKIRIVSGSYENIKITTAEDIAFAELILEQKKGA